MTALALLRPAARVWIGYAELSADNLTIGTHEPMRPSSKAPTQRQSRIRTKLISGKSKLALGRPEQCSGTRPPRLSTPLPTSSLEGYESGSRAALPSWLSTSLYGAGGLLGRTVLRLRHGLGQGDAAPRGLGHEA